MKKTRNAVVILILCIIGAGIWKTRTAPQLALTPEPELKDAVSGGPAHSKKSAPLKLDAGEDTTLRDSVAGNPLATPASAPVGNGSEDVPPPPRGSGEGGFGPLSESNPGQNIVPPPLSPSGPQSNSQNFE